MDIAQLDVKTRSEKGSFCHLTHPAFGHPMYTGEGADEMGRLIDENLPHEKVGALVRGAEAETVQKYLEKARRDALKGDEENKALKDDEDEDDLIYAKMLLIELVNITTDGKPLKGQTDKEKEVFFGLSNDFERQIYQHAAKREALFP